MVRDHGNPRIAVVLFQDGYRFIYILYCMLCQDGDCDVTVRTFYFIHLNWTPQAVPLWNLSRQFNR